MVTVHTVPKKIADDVERWVTCSKIPWYYFDGTLGPQQLHRHPVDESKYTAADLPRFSHLFFPNSITPKEDTQFIIPLTQWIKTLLPAKYDVRRVMGNLTTQLSGSENLINLPHIDSDDPKKITFLYYVNKTDGKTIFFNNGNIEHEVEPIRGTGALFPANTVHAGQLPCINKTRYVINIILSPRD